MGRALSANLRKVAEEEGFTEIAAAFRMISIVEAEHERRYLKLLSRLTDGNFFKRDGKIWWQCRNCGFIIEAEQAPAMCPACKHPPGLLRAQEGELLIRLPAAGYESRFPQGRRDFVSGPELRCKIFVGVRGRKIRKFCVSLQKILNLQFRNNIWQTKKSSFRWSV